LDLQKLLEILSPENLALAIVFIVPGWVALEAYSVVVPAERRNFGEELIRVVAVSLLNFLLFFVVLPLGLQRVPNSLGEIGLLGSLRLFMVLVLTPALLAVGVYYIRSISFISRFVVQPEPTAWDYYFREDREVLVIFYLREEAGSGILGGYFGSLSRASPYPGVQQVYIEELWDLGEDGSFLSPKEQSSGAIISYNDCAFVEFFELTDEDRERRSS
jgi:hypothetical protein